MAKDAEVDTGQPEPLYGAVAFDSGVHEDAGDDTDASADDASTGDDAASGDDASDGGASTDSGIVAAYGGFVGDASLEPDTGQGMASYGVFVNPDGGN